ncbi:ATP-binding cassette domain-containing protein [Staphylococcus sp. NRL 16/872]|uniref:ABC transporter ATP-binding protein n=1 Tax=Staphylococcus sp. NRL 16/872 TaxID=2930131 RepID=UPI001FB24794|nr:MULTISPECIES: ATP-binding cassette domain-containing protein [unclassified Staphylococcus]MCJ1655249.1 ATP-binding cassette domain-containing protein [Staphylococcus sp. NRL 21/187]MCJ1661082.1 ATP-binding cassette domain-containing protein [Staphylococcus sp. NRL 18/288]MCJ1666980.1 ATP-binding cassette domain-containing protein [Staphylococcus sp. NRL 19/737]WEN69453.1 ATP-binding cassette domain-containing protein [Staphylococcus sp. NRL 16/872]
MLEINNVTKHLGGKIIFKNISFEMKQHHLLISGESGSGKSTLAKILAGLDTDYSGQLYLNHKPRKDYTIKEWMKVIQYVPQYQRDTLNGRKTVRYILTEPLKNYHFQKETYSERIEAILERCALPSEILNQRIDTLSGGQFQRVWIAKALMIEPQILILDEATTNLDVINEESILQMLKTLKETQLIIISHDQYVLNSFEGKTITMSSNIE